MKRKFFSVLAGTALCLSITVAPMTANAATPDEAAALARSMGLPESLIQAGWNKYNENPELYPPELIDSYMATLRGMSQDVINQLLADNGFAPSTPSAPAPVVTTAPQQSQGNTVTTAKAENNPATTTEANGNTADSNDSDKGDKDNSDNKKPSLTDKITLKLPDGSTFERISVKEFTSMTLDDKRAYIASLTAEQKDVFLANMTPEDYKSLLKQLPLDNKADIIQSMADVTSQLGLTLSVDELTDENIVLSMKDEDGKLVALSAASDTVAATGYDRRGIFALAAALASLGIAGTAVVVKKSFGKDEV